MSDNPIAFKTCEDSILPVVQALPVDINIPLLSNSVSILSASTPLTEILMFPGNLFSISPFILISGILFFISFIR